VERLSYDAWGKRRTATGDDAWTDSVIAITPGNTPRGFTDHEHLDDFELVHMNGRVYEPVLGRFLSPDPFVQYPESTQGFNRYTYTFNNPLSHTDPSGYYVDDYGDTDWAGDDGGWGDDEGGIGGLDDLPGNPNSDTTVTNTGNGPQASALPNIDTNSPGYPGNKTTAQYGIDSEIAGNRERQREVQRQVLTLLIKRGMSLDQIADLLARHTIVAVHTGIIGGVLRQGLNARQRSLQILAVDANEELRYHFVAGSTTEFFGRHYTPRYQEFTAKVHKNPMTGTLNLHLTGTLQSGAPVYNLGGPIKLPY